MNFDLAAFTFGGGRDDPQDATPARRQEIWDEQQVEHNLARRGSSVSVGGRSGRKGAKLTMTTKEMLKELESLKQ